MVRKGLMTTGDRVDFLSNMEERIAYRTDLKFNSGCLQVPRTLGKTRARIFAQIYGVRGLANSDETNNLLFRWLLAHTGLSRQDFQPNFNHPQWHKTIRYYFQGRGHYAELALAEKLLFSRLKTKKTLIFSDIFPADRIADRDMATDWITHLSLPHGNIHLGVQVATNNSIGHKVQILLKRPVHDRDHTSESPLVRQFLRHNTAILAFPFFHPQADILEQGRKDLLSGNIDYQFHSLREHCPDFESYSRWIMELFEGLHRGIVERSIVHNRYCQNLSYDFPAKHGGTFVVECDTKEKRPFVTIQFFRDILRKNKNKIVALIMPIDPDFLDIYRDMAGVRAE